MRRVAVISYHSSPLLEPGIGDAGGMTVYVRAVAASLAKLGVGTDIFTRSSVGELEITDLFPAVRVISIPAGPEGTADKHELTGYLPDFEAGIRAFASGQGLEYDVVHSHYWQSGIAGTELAGAWGVPLVHSNHTLAKVKNAFLAPGDEPESAERLSGESEVIATADVLVASTDDEWENIACLYGASHDRVKSIYPGVDHDLFAPGSRATARAELGLGDEFILAYVGRIQPLKGLELALRAVDQLIPALDKEIKLIVVGGASGHAGEKERDSLLELARSLGISDAVRLEGAKPHALTPLYYRAADALVVCSYSESFGLSALEAQACGTPVVATDVGGLRHIVKDGVTGFLVDPRDPSVFAARLKTLLADEDLRREFSTASLASSAAFSWERTAGELADLYECLITERLPEACTC
jgi:D-inositol-3-phosphate glycosyltransferase